jgi:hypothetical protein
MLSSQLSQISYQLTDPCLIRIYELPARKKTISKTERAGSPFCLLFFHKIAYRCNNLKFELLPPMFVHIYGILIPHDKRPKNLPMTKGNDGRDFLARSSGNVGMLLCL